MNIDERKYKILSAIIRTYLDTGEPVGSRTLSKNKELNVSSATIRNEMADLEDLGLILQPHTSAGRIPTDKGYRLYVDHMMNVKIQEMESLNDIVVSKVDKIEELLQQIARNLAEDTNYTTMISAPTSTNNKIKFVQLSTIDSSHVLVVLVIEGNIVKNSMIEVSEKISEPHLLQLNILLNAALCGLDLNQISLSLVQSIKAQAGDYAQFIGNVIDAIAETIDDGNDGIRIITSGATNIFKYPELSDNQKASELISTLEEKKVLKALVNDTLEKNNENEIQIYIGSEAPVQAMRDCSIVTATYDLGKGMQGTVGIIGPKRMDYEHVVGVLTSLRKQLNNMLDDDEL